MVDEAVSEELLYTPLYSYAEADYIANVRPGTSKRWLTGYSYSYDDKRIQRPPVTNRASQPGSLKLHPGMVSFIDLIEVIVIGRLREIGFSLPAIRKIVANCRDLLKVERPLATLKFKTDGRDIFVPMGQRLLHVGKQKGQQAWDEVLGPFLEELDYTGSFVRRWWPLGKGQPVVVAPDIGFGLPTIARKGVRVEIIVERFTAGDSFEQIFEDYGVTREEVEAALRFELQRRAA